MKVFRTPIYPMAEKSARPKPPDIVPPVPRPFDFGLAACRPLVPMPAAVLFLNRNGHAVMKLIEEGRLRWAFDLRSARAEHKSVRILRQSLFEYAGLYVSEPEGPTTEEQEFLRVVELILPAGTSLSAATFQSGPTQWRKPAPKSVLQKLRVSVYAYQKLLFPAEPVLWGTEIAQCFSCNSQHVRNLIQENSLQAVKVRRGPKASPMVTRASVVDFLRKRRIS